MRRLFPLLVLAVLASLATGCALKSVPLELPAKGLEPTLSGGKGHQVVVQLPFKDGREIRHRCGMRKDGYNVDRGDVVCQSDPALWIGKLLADELRASGFEVLAADAPHRPGALRIEGSLTKLFVEPVIGVWVASLEADLGVTLQVTSETGLDAERNFFVKGWKGGVVMDTAQPYQTSFYRATQSILREMVDSILRLVERYPQLGSQAARALAAMPAREAQP